MVMGVFAEIRNGFDYFRKCKCFLDLSKETLCSILVFGNVRFNIVVRINHDKVASRELDVLTPLSDCRQESVEKMEQRILGVSYLYRMDLYNGISCCGLLCAHLISVCLFRLPHRGLPRPTDTLRLPRRGLPRPYRYIQANRPPRLQGYHTRATTLHTDFWVQAGYHTCG